WLIGLKTTQDTLPQSRRALIDSGNESSVEAKRAAEGEKSKTDGAAAALTSRPQAVNPTPKATETPLPVEAAAANVEMAVEVEETRKVPAVAVGDLHSIRPSSTIHGHSVQESSFSSIPEAQQHPDRSLDESDMDGMLDDEGFIIV
ncbi:MAG: hypothetical protein SGILL_003579, partial [Bacillariaceae sp.]